MRIIPVSSYEAKDRPWVTRLLRYIGFLIVILCTLFGIVGGGDQMTPMIRGSMGSDSNAVAIVVLILGGLFGFVAGLVISVPIWGLAMLLDDVRAIRMQTAGYTADTAPAGVRIPEDDQIPVDVPEPADVPDPVPEPVPDYVPPIDHIPPLHKEPVEKKATNIERVHVRGVNNYLTNIISVATENPDYQLTKAELVEDHEDERVYQYDFYVKAGLVPEPDNPYDPNAIMVQADGLCIGYVPKGSTSHVRKLMESGRIKSMDLKIGGGRYKEVVENDDGEYEIEKNEKNYSAVLELHLADM